MGPGDRGGVWKRSRSPDASDGTPWGLKNKKKMKILWNFNLSAVGLDLDLWTPVYKQQTFQETPADLFDVNRDSFSIR